MDQNVALISTIAASLGLALVFGYLAVRLNLPALVGYLLAGVLLGPYSPGFVADADLANQLAGIGVMLLMFNVGLNFSIEELLVVKRIALPGAIVQIITATTMGTALAMSWGWPWGSAIVFGVSLSVASTVVLIKALDSQGITHTLNGHITIGWVVVEDLVMVLILVLLPPLSVLLGGTPPAGSSEGSNVLMTLLLTLAKVAAFVAFMLIIGKRLFPWLLWQGAKTNSREIFTLCIFAVGVGVAYGSGQLFGISYALGAFFAGMVLRGTELSYRAANDSMPLRDAFSVLFFVSVGMLFDFRVIAEEPLRVLSVVGIILLGKSIVTFTIVLLFKYPLQTALIVAASLAQIGEFSFILAGLGLSLGLIPPEGSNLILAGSIISIAMNQLVLRGIAPIKRWLGEHTPLNRLLSKRLDPLAELPPSVTPEYVTDHILLVGYGRVGQRIFQHLVSERIKCVVVEANREEVEHLRKHGYKAVAGDASDRMVLAQGHVSRAHILIIAIPDTFQVRKILETARALNPDIISVVRTHSDEEQGWLNREHVEKVFLGEHELANSMISYVSERLKAEDACREVTPTYTRA